MDIVGPHDVFTGAALLTEGGYRVSVVSQDGQPISTSTSLAVVAHAMPDPGDIDTLVLPGGPGIDAARQDRDLVAWIKTAASNSAGWSACVPARFWPPRQDCSMAAG